MHRRGRRPSQRVGALLRHVTRVQIGIPRELVVATGAVDFAGLLESLADLFLCVPVPFLQLEKRAEGLVLDDRVAFDLELADAITISLGDRDAELDPARLAVVLVFQDLQLGLTDARGDVSLVAVVADDVLGVFLELLFLVSAAAGDEPEEAAGLVLLHALAQLAVADRSVPDEVDLADLDLWPLSDVEGEVHQLRPARYVLDGRLDLREHMAVGGVNLAHHAGHAANRARIDERVDPEPNPPLLQFFFDLALVDLLGIGRHVVNDLDPLPFFHAVHDELADYAVAHLHVDDFDGQVVEEGRRP